jgi:uncharacterized membrane protein
MSLLQTIRNNIIVTDPSQTDVAYDVGFLSATYMLTKSWRFTGLVALGLVAGETVNHVVIPTVAPLVVRGWNAMKEMVSSRSCCPSQKQEPIQPTA